MSSIKRDVKKKVLPRPESRFVSRDPAHFPSALAGAVLPFDSHKLLSASGGKAIGFERAASQWWLSVSTMVLSEARGL